MPRRNPPADLIDFVALPDRDRQLERLDLWLPSEFVPMLRRWANREGPSVAALLARHLCDAINLDDMAYSPLTRHLPEPPLPENVTEIGPRKTRP